MVRNLEIRGTAAERRRAFTLIELLVVIAIIAILVALLLPAVQAAREAARRSQCKNNLMQVAIALQNYEMAHEVLPPGSVNPDGPIESEPEGYHVGWIVQILPYLEQQNIYNHLDFSAGVYDETNQEPRSMVIDVLSCPSDPNTYNSDGPGLNSYVGCHHDDEAPIDADNHGVLYLNSATRYEDIGDGSSNTLFVGERAIPSKQSERIRLGWASGTRATLRNTGTTINENREQLRRLDPQAEQPGPLDVGGFSSYHQGGAHFAFGDGSIQFISENIEAQTFRNLGHRADGEMMGEL